MADDERLGMFESANRRLTSHAREIIQELIQRLPAFQVVQESLKRDTCSPENRRTTKHIRISGDDLVPCCHGSLPE